MNLYHGTAYRNWESIKAKGLQPRGASPAHTSNWAHSIESNPDTVYLTETYPMYFAIASTQVTGPEAGNVLLIEIDTDKLPGTLVPDEDALEQVSRGKDGLPSSWGMVKRTRYYRDLTRSYAETKFNWVWSLSVLGTCGHLGSIPLSAMTRIAKFNMRGEVALSFVGMDMSVWVMNHIFMKHRNRNIVNTIFGYPLEEDPLNSQLPSVAGKITLIDL